MNHKLFRGIAVLLFCCMPVQIIAAPTLVKIATDNWVGYTNLDGSGFYFDALKQIFPEPEWQLEIEFVPFSRVRYLIANQKVDMALGFYPADSSASLYSEQPIEVDSVDIALTPELAAMWQGVESLAYKKVQALLEYRFDELIAVPMYYEESVNLLDLLNRVNQGRIDAVLDYKPAMLAKVAELSHPRQFVIVENVFSLEVYFVFSNNSSGKNLKTHFDKRLEQLVESGELDKLFKVYVGEGADRLNGK
ncbi:ABC transporter substrate-binding protein [Shewanella sp. UCD-KL12]|uniref:substrate-binding periplasmic protein n=1 Tax=Shewanella sp. UCD-KL12 TaxID=1917163 RepID=UPI0009F8FB65|nr:transporter substrate-binding domain-containing protein [Shewanella sp. UCD-KL12]